MFRYLFSHTCHGKGLWLFNNSLLYDIEYFNIIYKTSDEIKLQNVIQYRPCVRYKNKDINFTINDELFWRHY